MNNTLQSSHQSSHLVSLNGKPENKSLITQQALNSLTLVKSRGKLNLPTLQQKKAIAQIYVEQAWIYFQERNWAKAIAACQNALNLDPQHTDAYKIFGNILKITGKKAEALGIYAKALEINPNSAPIYANLGSFHADQKNWQQALDYYQQAIVIDPNLAGAYRSLARIWEELGEGTKALECLCQAVNLEPEKFTAEEYFNFGDRLLREGKLKEASIFYIHGVELNPHAQTQLAQLVKILEELEEWQEAVVFYHKLISLANGESPQQNLALTKPITHLLSQAKSVAKQNLKSKEQQSLSSSLSLPVKPNSALSWYRLANSYVQKQQWVKAISCYQESLELDPNQSKTYRNLAKVYRQIKKEDQAILAWYEAFNLEPNLIKPQEHFNLAQQLLRLGQPDKAIACLKHAIELDPNFNQAYLVLGKLLESQGKTTQAQACYAKVES